MNLINGAKNEDKIIRTPKIDYVPDPRGLGYVFFTQMQKHGDRLAQIDGQTGERDSYRCLLKRCVRTATTMRSKGVKPNGIISICSFNHLDSAVPFMAALFLGARSASLDPTLSLADTIALLKQVTPKMIFVVPTALKQIEEAVAEVSPKTEIVVFGHTNVHTPFTDFLKPNSEEAIFKPYEVNSLKDTAAMFFSSGTSGLPKVICISHLACLCQTANTMSLGYCTDLTLAFASFYWVTSVIFWGTTVMKGAARLVLPCFDATTVWKIIAKYKPTLMFIAPSQILAMHHQGRPTGIETNSLKDIIIGGGPLSEQQIIQIRKNLPGTRVCLGYGQTEVFGFLACMKPSNAEEVAFMPNKPTSSGRGIPGISYKVLDLETEEILGPNQKGELRVRTEYHLNGYHNIDSSDAWDAEGWLKTGDVVYYDDDLCFYVVDRIKEMLKFQSWHVPPASIEHVILSHPAIQRAVVIGMPHEIDGDHPMALVVLKKAFIKKQIVPEDIIKYVDERVHDRQRLRGGVMIVDQLPVTPSGKVKRREVKNMVLKTKEQR